MASAHKGPVQFHAYQERFAAITGPSPKSEVLCQSNSGESLYHEACVYHAPTESVFVTSNQLPITDGSRSDRTSNKKVTLLRIYDAAKASEVRVEEVTFPGIEGSMLNGGVNYHRDSILLCAQGSKDLKDISGIIDLAISPTCTPLESREQRAPKLVIGDFHGVPFNSVNDVIVHPSDGSIWFTDPSYGFHQGVRPKPSLPNQVYRYDAARKTTRTVADGFVRPNGLCFSPDLKTLYVTDTGAIHGSSDVPIDLAGPSHIYAFDLHFPGKGEDAAEKVLGPFLINRRLFAFAPGRCPDGIKCDLQGNVYSGCLDGISVWDPSGEPLGDFKVEGGVANFCFGAPGVMYACNETRFIKITIASEIEGALLGTQRLFE
jgi:gluconolactonase